MCLRNSNTSHVILYLYNRRMRICCHSFKYISCYSLSKTVYLQVFTTEIQIHLMLFFIVSRLKVYRQCSSFKYISCYSLSCPMSLIEVLNSLFKYISCYSLSLPYTRINGGLPHSNTSHVILYLHTENHLPLYFTFKYISCYSLSLYAQRLNNLWRNSNTSHVILYLIPIVFISTVDRFKYISCYSLSK